MSLICRDLDEVEPLAELFAPFVEDDSVFVEVFGLSYNWLGALQTSRETTPSETQSLSWTCLWVLLHRMIALIAAHSHSDAWLSSSKPWKWTISISFRLRCRQRESWSTVGSLELVWKLTHIVPDPFNLLEVLHPFGNAVCRLLFLQPL